MDFGKLTNDINGLIGNPFAGKTKDGEWVFGWTSVDYLNNKFGHFNDVDDMIASTDIESEKMLLKYLKNEGLAE